MTPRISGHISIFCLVFFVLKSLLGIVRRWTREEFVIVSLKPRNVDYWSWPFNLKRQMFFLFLCVCFFCFIVFVCLFAADGTCAGVSCHSNATCKTLIQGPTCECNDGYQGSGTECTGKWVNHMPNSKTASYSSFRVCQRPVVKGAMLHYLLSFKAFRT